MADINLGVGGANSAVAGGYDIDNSLKLESDNAEYLDNRHNNAGNRRTWTLSFWIKRTELGTTQKPYDSGNAASGPHFTSGDALSVENSNLYLVTNRVFRDTSAWYHIVLLNDSTQSTASNRAKLWINGVQETSFSSETYMAQNQEGNINSATSVSIGGGGGAHVNGYMAELFFVDGQALAPTDFGEFDEDTGIWKPKEYEGTLSGTSIKLDFSNSAALWTDSSGLTGNGTVMSGNNITSADQATDTPTNNFCTWFPLWTFPIGRTISEGGTNVDGSSAWGGCKGTIGVTNGKWYWENKASGNQTIIGWQTDNCIPESNENSMHNIKDTIGFYQEGNNVWIRDETSGRTDSTTTGTNVSGQIIGMALDLDSSPQTATFYRNGSAISSAINIDGLTGKTIFPFMSQYNFNAESNFGGFCTYTISSAASDANGYGTFEYAPPSGYYALCTKNLAEYG